MDNVVWNYIDGKLALSAVAAVIGTAVNTALGGFDKMLYALMIFMILDFVLGFMSAWKLGTVNSRIMFWGGINKLLILSLVALGVCLDWLFGYSEPFVRTAVIWFYIGREFLSVVENYGKMGFSLPPVFENALEQIKSKTADITDDSESF